MRKLLLILFFGLCFASRGQEPFQKHYVGVGRGKAFERLSSGNLFTGIGGKSIMDPYGHILHSRCHDVQPFTNIQGIRKRTDNEFYFVGGLLSDSCAVATSLEVNPVFGKMDSLGNILSLIHYQLNAVTCSNISSDLVITSEGGAVVWGSEDSFFVLRLDVNGLPVWSKQFLHNGAIGFIKELPGGDLLAGFQMDTVGASVARIAANGDILWCKSYMRPDGDVCDAVVRSDSSFTIVGFTSTAPRKLFTMHLNGAGEVQWCRGYDNGVNSWDISYRARMVGTQDGNSVILSTLGQTAFPYFFRPLLMKVDQNGDTLWTRSAGADEYIYYGDILMESEDGGLYYSGDCWGDFGSALSSVYLFKTDILGHVPCHERLHPVGVVELFPSDSGFTLPSIEGAEAIATSNSIVPCLQGTIYDGCTLQPTRVPPVSKRPPNMSVRPNPNNGRFTMAFKDPLVAESWYAVYDGTGKLLFQRRLNPGKGTEEVDLSRYGKGTYVIKCTDKEGVYHERVVVE